MANCRCGGQLLPGGGSERRTEDPKLCASYRNRTVDETPFHAFLRRGGTNGPSSAANLRVPSAGC
jgi:hypothetical protein